MATYKGIQGFTIQNLSADPSNPIEGQVWYNSTSNVWKVEEATTAGAWATGGTMGTARYGLTGAGTQTAALAFGGGLPVSNATEEYDGASWTASGSLNTSRAYLGSGGTQTAGLAFGGYTPAVTGATEEYNGSTWANNPTGLGTARRSLGGCGTQTAGLTFGGTLPPFTGATESYDGSTWTTGGTMGTARYFLGSAGIQTAGLAFGGNGALVPGIANATEEWTGAGAPLTQTITVS